MAIRSSGGGGGSGNVSGAASSDDNAIARYDGATGKAIQNSTVTIDDVGNIATPESVTVGAGKRFQFGSTSNRLGYTDGTGPTWTDNSSEFTLTHNIQALGDNRTVTWPGKAAATVSLLTGGLNIIGFTSSAAGASTTEYPADKDCGIHKNTTSGAIHLAYNDGGVIKAVALT